MTDYRNRIETLTRYLAAVDERLAGYEAKARTTRQPLSQHFREKIEDARREHVKLAAHLAELKREDATEFTAHGPAERILAICDKIGGRIDAALAHLEHRR